MGWFDEQIHQRMRQDQEAFDESFAQVASAVLGRRAGFRLSDDRVAAKAAMDEILKFYHFKPKEVPESVKDPEEQLEYLLRPHGLMRRSVELTEGWYRDAYGPMLGFYAEDGSPVALLPSGFSGYSFTDRSTGKKVRVTRANASRIAGDAICFYRPLPLRRIGIPDLILYLKDCLQSRDYVLIVLSTLAVTFVSMIAPRLSRALTGPVMRSGSPHLLVGIAIFMVCTALSGQLLSAVRTLLMSRIETKTALSVEAAMMMRIISLPVTFFRQYGAGELAQRSRSVNQLCAMLIGMVLSTGLTSLSSLLYITQIFQYAPALARPALAIILVTVAFSAVSSLLQIRISRERMELEAKKSGMTYSMLTGIQKIKLAGAEKRFFARWARMYADSARLTYDPPLFIKINGVIMMGIGLAGTLIMYALAVRSGVAVEDYFAFNAAYSALFGAFSALAGMALTVAQIRPILEMAEPFLKAEPEVAENKSVLTRLSGGIELSNVSFRYTESMPYVIDDLSLKIRPGEYVAIVGSTGCGKTTLMRLLLGFEKPDKGAIYYDGRDISKVDLKSLRRRIGAVTQNGGLFQGSLYENITISAPQLSVDAAWEAAELAGLADDIRAMPMGMQTMVAEGGGGISGGQKQRVMIARAVAPKPKVLMFDEATSALDNKTQRQVSEALDALKCTRIVIAHRLSTIRNCDRIIYLEKGTIVEDGTYDQLIALDGRFADLVARQRLDV